MRAIGSALESTTVLWRYMQADRLAQLLESGSLYFAAASQFEDKFEGAAFVEPPTLVRDPRERTNRSADHAFKELTRLTKVCCWHIAEFESDAMWKLYAAYGKGAAIRTTVGDLEAALHPFRLRHDYGAEEPWSGPVQYVDLRRERLHVSAIERFFVKHRIFEWEREYRVAISLTMAEEFGCVVPEKGISVGCDLHRLLNALYTGPYVTEEERQFLEAAAQKAGVSQKMTESSALGTPRYA